MKELLEKYAIGKYLLFSKFQVEEWGHLDARYHLKFLNVCPDEDAINRELFRDGLNYDKYYKSYIKVNPYSLYKSGKGISGKVQSFKFRLLIEDLLLVEQTIFKLFKEELSQKGFVIKDNQHEIRVFVEKVNSMQFLHVFGTENYKMKNPKFWICKSYSKEEFNRAVDISFYSLHDAIKYSIQEVLHSSRVTRDNLGEEDVEVTLDDQGVVTVSVVGQMEESKSFVHFKSIIKRCPIKN